MADQSAVNAQHATLTGAAVDKITLTGRPAKVDVLNRGGTDIYVTIGHTAAEPTDPTVGGDETEIVGAGGFITLTAPIAVPAAAPVVKIIGNGNAYSVIGVR